MNFPRPAIADNLSEVSKARFENKVNRISTKSKV
jgi:hypothetical protein